MKKSGFIGVSNLKRTLLFLSAVLVVMTFSGVAHNGYAYTTLNVPNSCNTYAYGIDGNNIVGTYKKVQGSNDYYVFLYDITTSTYTTLPDSPVSYYPGVVDIDRNNIVGCYRDSIGYHGFIYDIITETYSTLDFPGSGYTHAYGIDGNNIVGCYWDEDDSTYLVFLYDITTSTYTTLDVPASAWYAEVVRIDGNNIVGYYFDGSGHHGFIYDITTETYTTLDVPDANSTYAYGIDGNNIVGTWYNGPPHGFLYNITSQTYTTLDAPDADDYTEVWGIDGNNIVGWYLTGMYSQCGTGYGFVTSEPGITPSPQEALGEIVNTVIVLNLHAGISNSLDSKLQNAISALDDMNENNDVAAINSLNAFINAVEAQRGNKITEEDADALIAETNAIIAQLEAQ
jgi:hypothetical protein